MASRMGYLFAFALLMSACGASVPASCGDRPCDSDDALLLQTTKSKRPAAHKPILSEEAADIWSRSAGSCHADGYCFNGYETCKHEISEGWNG